jgi:predicted transcriptional regulator
MDEDQLNDLKQFIATTVSQATASMATKDDLQTEISKLKSELNQRFDEVQAAIAETISGTNDGNDEQLSNHEQRIARLEQQVA